MRNPSKTRLLVNEFQMVIALVENMVDASEEEVRTVRDLFLSAVKPLEVSVVSCDVTPARLEARITFGNTLQLGNIMRTVKSVTGRRFGQRFPGRPHLFASGYMVRTIGNPIDPDEAVRQIRAAAK
jgi:hypothetical protein